MFLNRKFTLSSSLSLFAAVALSSLAAAQIAPNNLVVLRVGDGSAALTNASQPAFLDEYMTTAGPAVQSIALPTAISGSNFPLTNSGTATSEGFLNLSTDLQYLIMTGYGTAPGTASIASTTSVAVPRVIGRVSLSEVIDTSTALSDAFSANNPRSASSTNGTQLWAAGAAAGNSGGGIRYATLGATTSTQLPMAAVGAFSNGRVTNIFGGQLYVSSSSGAYVGINTVGTGTPTTTGQTVTPLPGFPITGQSAYDFFFADANTLYVADDRTSGPGGIQKYTFTGSTWLLAYTLAPATNVGCRGLTGHVNAGVTTLYATTTTTPLNDLVAVTDTGAGSLFTTLATAATNTVLRGVRFIEPSAPPGPTSFCLGDGTSTPCPCGNNATTLGNGCGTTGSPGGASLSASGNASDETVSGPAADTLVLTGTGLVGPALFFQADSSGGTINFGDGHLCANQNIQRMGVVFPVAGVASYPGGTTPFEIHTFGNDAGETKLYQCWYRVNPALCNPGVQNFSLTQGISLVWGN